MPIKETRESFKTKDEFIFKLDNEEIRVEFDGNWLSNYMMHFSFYGKAVSETGYRSHFLLVEDFKELGYTDYKVCARDIAVSLYKELKNKLPRLFENRKQLKLF